MTSRAESMQAAGVDDDAALRRDLMRVVFRFKRAANAAMGTRSHGISLAEFMLLRLLETHALDAPSNVSHADLGRLLSITKGAVSQMLASLEERGLVSRVPAPGDRRSTLAVLTHRGRALIDDEENGFDERLDALVGAVGREDVAQLISIVDKLTDALDTLRAQDTGTTQ